MKTGGFLEEVARTDDRGGSYLWGQDKSSGVGDSAHRARQEYSLTEDEGSLSWRLESTQPHGTVAGSMTWATVTTAVSCRAEGVIRKPPPCLQSLLTSLKWLGTARRETLASSRTSCQIKP